MKIKYRAKTLVEGTVGELYNTLNSLSINSKFVIIIAQGSGYQQELDCTIAGTTITEGRVIKATYSNGSTHTYNLSDIIREHKVKLFI